MRKSKKYIILALSYVVVHILLMIWVSNTDVSFNHFINLIIYLMSVGEYLAITLYPIASSMKKVWIIIPEEKNLDFSSIKRLGWFITITLIIGYITAGYYGIRAMIFLVVFLVNGPPDISAVFLFPITIGNMILPACLAIDAHINKWHIEKYFHLLYMVFAPISPFILIDIGDYPTREAFHNAFDTFIVIVISIPLLFVLRNYYLWYRRYRQERKDLRKNGG